MRSWYFTLATPESMTDNKKSVLTFSADVHPDGSQVTTKKIYDSMADVQAARRDRELALKANHDKTRTVAKHLLRKTTEATFSFSLTAGAKVCPIQGQKSLPTLGTHSTQIGETLPVRIFTQLFRNTNHPQTFQLRIYNVTEDSLKRK